MVFLWGQNTVQIIFMRLVLAVSPSLWWKGNIWCNWLNPHLILFGSTPGNMFWILGIPWLPGAQSFSKSPGTSDLNLSLWSWFIRKLLLDAFLFSIKLLSLLYWSTCCTSRYSSGDFQFMYLHLGRCEPFGEVPFSHFLFVELELILEKWKMMCGANLHCASAWVDGPG